MLLPVWCCPAQSLSVYTFTNGGNLRSATPFRYLAMRFTFILIALCGTRDFSCCFLHAVHDVSTLLAHVQQLSRVSCTRLASRSSAQPVTLSLVSSSHLELTRSRAFQTKHSDHVSDVLRICFIQVFTSRSLNHSAPRKQILPPNFFPRPTIRIITLFDKSLTNRKTSLLGPKQQIVINVNENIDVMKTTQICQDWMII